MNSRFSKPSVSGIFSAIVCAALVMGTSVGFAASSSATSRVGITKLESLQVSDMNNSELMLSKSTNNMQTETCMQSLGADMPYRISASSLAGKNQFMVKGDSGAIPYQVSWSSGQDQRDVWTLDSLKDQTGVLSATSSDNCVMNTMSVQISDRDFNNAVNDTYTDTLSLMLVIE